MIAFTRLLLDPGFKRDLNLRRIQKTDLLLTSLKCNADKTRVNT